MFCSFYKIRENVFYAKIKSAKTSIRVVKYELRVIKWKPVSLYSWEKLDKSEEPIPEKLG